MPRAGDLLQGAAPATAENVLGGFVDLDGERYYRIRGTQSLPPFFMTVAGSGDAWLFLSSTGGITAGRRNADGAVFPYYTEDKIVDTASASGGISLLRVHTPGAAPRIWRPFAPSLGESAIGTRAVYRSVWGDRVVLEEQRPDLGLTVRVGWRTSGRFGVIRECTVLSDRHTRVELLDGVHNVLPPGVTPQTQNHLSNLLDAYKRAEVDQATGVATIFLSSLLTDRAEPAESLLASTVWHTGLPGATLTLDPARPLSFGRGLEAEPVTETRGERAAYLLEAEVRLAPGESVAWAVMIDTDQDAAEVVDLVDLVADEGRTVMALVDDQRRSRAALGHHLAGADALQSTGDESASAHHLANVLFNAMRGGVPARGYAVSSSDVGDFVAERSTSTASRCSALLKTLPSVLSVRELVDWADGTDDPDLARLAREYLPLTFSRRHGDPSRPWNAFDIVVEDEGGSPRLDHQGNWRDIFQNWEALAWSYPDLTENMVTVFLDATTIDGYNPYRISRSGIDWEVPEPDNPWSNIGYWSDHQVIYLLKLLETMDRFDPGRASTLIGRKIFTHADVPYRIKDHDDIVANPFDTIEFDSVRNARSRDAVATEGGDALLRHDAEGMLVRATMGEKLLLILAAKVVLLVPDAGIWMTTQRPEWNDANNALVGRGTSIVTVAHLYRFVTHLQSLIHEPFEVSGELHDLVGELMTALETHRGEPSTALEEPERRRRTLDALGAAGTTYRHRVEGREHAARVLMEPATLDAFLREVRTHLEGSLRRARRTDGLYHSYTTLHLGLRTARVGDLPEMLEGQVAVLSSGLLDAHESLNVLVGLRASRLYRRDQNSYLLYPDRSLRSFLDRNTIPRETVHGSPLLSHLANTGGHGVVVKDGRGGVHFAPGMRNVSDLRAAVGRLADDRGSADAMARDDGRLEEAYEALFDHDHYLGRSGTFFAFEGLGSIYWHMVAKLLVAVLEVIERAVHDGESPETVAALRAHYEDIRGGLGVCKTPAEFGAFPVDPYSHTPAGHGARQPGMTGQVKEEILTRLGELGMRVEDGRIVARGTLLRDREWHTAPTVFAYVDVDGTARSIELPAGSLAFTFCHVPVVYHRSERPGTTVTFADDTVQHHDEAGLPRHQSAHVFGRTGWVRRIDVRLPL